jgi:hypothetical protein
LLERRIAKLSDELTQRRRRRDQLQLRIDDTPEEITSQQVATLGEEVHNIINYGADTERKQVCEPSLRSCGSTPPPPRQLRYSGSTSPHHEPSRTHTAPRPAA